MKWFLNLLICVSQGFNAIVLFGNPDETFSARCYRNRHIPKWAFWYRAMNRLYFWQEDHCADSYAEDVARAGWVLGAHRRANNRAEIADDA